MGWPPRPGESLPRAADAWCAQEKWLAWILAAEGHGPEWAKVLRVEAGHWEFTWATLKEAVREAAIETVRPLEAGSVSCGVTVEITIGRRTALVVSAWHYAEPGAAPRLVTAYPTAYNRGYGSNA
ncbi:MAG TPA: hypothetical protein VHP56_12485 [Solirubrobacterales bacterium]|nr:hypothetical protein [Solirubrobacterales bacterium]